MDSASFSCRLAAVETDGRADALEPWRAPGTGHEDTYRLGGIEVVVSGHATARISVPLAGADQLYFSADTRTIRIAADPRRLVDHRAEIDADGLTSLLQFGALVPPLSVWRSVRRFRPGRSYELDARAGTVTDVAPTRDRAVPPTHPGNPSDRLCALLDELLLQQCPDRRPVILFSGGVDSGVLAARAAALGWRDTLLLNYAMGPDDPESAHAEAMAESLGLPFERVVRDPAFGDEFLDGVVTNYRQPFCDVSCIPTLELARHAVRVAGDRKTVIDGTGADGAFGLFAKAESWRRLYRIPLAARRAAAHLYDRFGLWQRSSRIEYVLRLLARASDLSPAPAAIAQSPVHGNLLAPGARSPVAADHLDDLLSDAMPLQHCGAVLSALDMALICSDRFAQKNKMFFDRSGLRIVYPFLDDRIVGLALTEARAWPDAREPKVTLKRILARSVPTEMVFRPKRGFAPPIREYLARPAYLRAFDRLFEEDSTVGRLLDSQRCERLRPLLANSRALPMTTVSIVWTALIADQWLRQFEAQRRPPADVGDC